ncbi:hypothetical protein ACIQ9R_36040 [Streptomyces sp. NPDC094447]|uniref:hypothetical protein n=1 Tax=Streptomyces sp. NPDC094447 TaxID=3366062 RepID=UPI0037F5AD16
MDSDPERARRTAAAVMRALEASPELVATNMSEVVPNRRGPGGRVYLETILLEARSPAGAEEGPEVTVERADGGPGRAGGGRRALPRGPRALGR